MDYSEEMVPIASRIFLLEGRFSCRWVEKYKASILPTAIQKYGDKLDEEWKNTIKQYLDIPSSDTYCYFLASLSYADLYIGKAFDIVYQHNDVGKGVKCRAVILAIIHEWAKIPVPYVGQGHRSICLIDFPNGFPNIITDLPEIDNGKDSYLNNGVALCNIDTWNVMIEKITQ